MDLNKKQNTTEIRVVQLTGDQLKEITLNIEKLKQKPPVPHASMMIPNPKKDVNPFYRGEETSMYTYYKLNFQYDFRLNDYVLGLVEEI